MSGLKEMIQKAMTEFKEAEKEEKKHLSKRIKHVEEAFEERYKNLKKTLDKEKKTVIFKP